MNQLQIWRCLSGTKLLFRLSRSNFQARSGPTRANLDVLRLISGVGLLLTLGGLILFAWLLPQPATAQTGDLFSLQWSSAESDNTFALAWGDYDNDGDLDLAVGNWGRNRLYRNDGLEADGVTPLFSPVWSSNEADNTYSLAWGDVDGDGDLDLAVGNGCRRDIGTCHRNRLYRNDDGMLTENAVWSSAEIDATASVAWGDYDGDGDLDLVVGNWADSTGGTPDSQPNRLYRNDGGMLTESAVWSSDEEDLTNSVAWGDWDNDGDLDLAVGNGNLSGGQANRLYCNQAGILSVCWSSDESDETISLTWGDYDDDGDLDLAVGNGCLSNLITCHRNRLYRNDGLAGDGVTPLLNLVWSSNEQDNTVNVVWGDYDNDGDLDLAVGNFCQIAPFICEPNRLYRNDGGGLTNEAAWSSNEEDYTISIAWGDYDGDGDLDLAVGNAFNGQANRLYRNNGAGLTNSSVWSSDEVDDSRGVAWGDYDHDDDLDLAVGNSSSRSNRLYHNDGGDLVASAGWSSDETDNSLSVAWGDYDGDGDLDLAVGNREQPNRLYRNDSGTLATSAVWSSNEEDYTLSLAWGDYDGDGDLDLAVGNGCSDDLITCHRNRLYRNDGLAGDGVTPLFNLVWSSDEQEFTKSVAWGDYDGDGDLDLAAGNKELPNRLYRNEGGGLTDEAVWSSNESNTTFSVAWGDYDGDGDLDLAAGNFGQRNRLYRNDDGMLTESAVWSSNEVDLTQSLAWGDYDGDGDLDLAAGNGGGSGSPFGQPNRLYRNDGGTLTASAVWSSDEADSTISVAWGDYDGDGDLDLAMGNYKEVNRLYQNLRRGSAPQMNNPPYLTISRPGITDEADFFSTPQIIQAADIPISYSLFDPEGDIVPKIFPEFSPNGGGQWFPATPGSGGDGITNLTASPAGTPHTFVWHAAANLIKSDNVIFRIKAQPHYTHSLILWSAVDGQSPSFRVAAPWYIKVVDDNGNPVAGVPVYANGQPITQTVTGLTVTDRAGLLNPGPLDFGTTLVALAQVQEQTTPRAAHDGWAYRLYLTNLNLDGEGAPQPDVVSQPGEQRLTVGQDTPLILFNIVVSVEWDATKAYLMMLEDAFGQASDYLYDITDGQMAFGQVNIYDQAEHWAEADFQFSTKNIVRPYAFVGGITSEDEAHTIRVGRFWDGGSGNNGNWNEPHGYRTLVHEFAHYALYLYDEYFMREVDEGGNFIREVDAFCTREEVMNNNEEATNASLMFYQYNATELADKTYNWDQNCTNTEQYRLNDGQSDWETVLSHYDGPGWTLNSPSEQGGVMAGPDEFPTALLPFPEVISHNLGLVGGSSRQLTVLSPQGQPIHNALVALYTTVDQVTLAIDQGLTDRQGQIAVYGAAPGDTIRAATFDGALAGGLPVGSETSFQLTLMSTGTSGPEVQAGESPPYLNLIPGTEGDTLTLMVRGTPADSSLLDAVVIPGEGGGSPQPTSLAYSSSEGGHVGTVSLSGVGLGTGRVRVSGDALPGAINSDYNLQQVRAITANHLYSEDGNFELHIPPQGIPADGYATVLPTGYVPGPLPAGKQVIGSAYEVRLSGAVTELGKEGLVRLHYHPAVMGVYTDTTIYYWNPSHKVWQEQGGASSQVDNALTVPARRLGIYALMGAQVAGIGDNHVYLPIILKQ